MKKKRHQCTLIFCCCFFENKLGPHLGADHTSPTGRVWPSWITRSCSLWTSLLGAPLWNQLSQLRSCSYQTLSWLQTSVAEPVGLVSFLVTNDCHYFPASQPWPGWYRSDGVWIEAAPVLGPWCMRKYSWSLLFSAGLSTGREVSTSWVRKDRWWLVERSLKIRAFLVLLFFLC